MYPFRYQRAADVRGAVAAVAGEPSAQFVAGGTSQVDLMKENVHRPTSLVDVSRLPLSEISALPAGGIRIGANVSNSEAARNDLVRERYPALCEAILAGASRQIRNMASMGGNILQRTRCPYFRDTAQPCNKREPGSGCAALAGYNRVHAIFGQTDEGAQSPNSCIATHPSDLAVALAAHRALVLVEGPQGARQIAFEEFHRLPGQTPQIDTNLRQGELIVGYQLPAFAGNSHYLKARDRASYAYALVSVAVALEMDGERIAQATLALGSVAHKPWRAPAAEALLVGQTPSPELFERAGQVALQNAVTYEMNAYKVPMARNLVARALMETSGLAPLAGPKGTGLAASLVTDIAA